VLLYRRGADDGLEVLIAHPGGPFWAGKEEGAWSLPKGEIAPGEDPVQAAIRELAEETGIEVDPGSLADLGTVTQRGGKVVHGFAAAADVDPAGVRSNTFTMEWPPRSGRLQEFPEIDRVAWMTPRRARVLLNPAQVAFVDRLERLLDHGE